MVRKLVSFLLLVAAVLTKTKQETQFVIYTRSGTREVNVEDGAAKEITFPDCSGQGNGSFVTCLTENEMNRMVDRQAPEAFKFYVHSDIESAKGDEEEEHYVSVCESKVKSMPVYEYYPKDPNEPKLKRKYVINTGKYKQVITVEFCSDERAKCGVDPKDGITTECRTEYNKRNILLFDFNTRTVSMEPISVPSGCGCYYS